ncbi:ATP-binding cassette domain-containing protein [Sphaerisporangium corydalis]|uniref:ATP-binding cassette domain-containing protein n=1 Tax=Sphaerisporangium corydalis TaxID=1441875 RepID=A0ABV9E7Z9_9ACTN|nr:ATP-binding cassette domain-containing protein [Sphaerisporangium corydalis]
MTGKGGNGMDVDGIPPAVLCEELRYRFGEHRAVDGVSLRVVPGEIFGLLGPNGAGKTTTIRVLTTLLPLQEGRAAVFGVDVARRRMEVRRLMGYVPQQLSANGALTGRENVSLFARLFDVPRRERRDRVAESLEVMGLTGDADRVAATYSGGMVRRLELAQALVNHPRLLILDEPTIGLDPLARSGVWERLNELRATTGMTVLVTTHSMDEADTMCDRVALMHLGRLRAIGTPAELKSALGEDATLEDVFRHHAGDALNDDRLPQGGFSEVRTTRRTAGRLG